MSAVRVISTSTIQAPSQADVDSTQFQKIHLTPWDLESLNLRMNQKGLLFHNPINAEDTQIQIQIKNLERSLSSTLAFFPPFAGCLIITEHKDNTASAFIACNNVGVLFVHAVAENTSVADILKPNYVPPIVHSFFPLNGVKNKEGTSQPLLAVQVTNLVDGIFIGCTINHVAADGKSFWHFINSWAEISRGFDKITKLPLLEHWFLDGINPPIRFPFTKKETQHSENPNPHPKPLPVRIFHFTKEKISQLKSKANAEATAQKISSLQALLTHLWCCVIPCKRVDPQEEICYLLAIDVRRRLVPPLPENYFGNALQVGVVTMKAGELLEGGFCKGAWEMNKMIALQSDEKVKSHYESMARTPILLQPDRLSNRFALATGSSPRFDVYGNDFGWGKPVAVRSGGSTNINGMVTMFAGAEEGSVDLEVCLPYEILESMGDDPDFINGISN
ncbi:protein ENHANCED PSEUDOMONAS SUSCEPTIBILITY 1-like [Gastrolobium bilobum]|uniref:protein ENHANCED PSEUDOMONAS SUSCEPTIBILITY 1-like n=1 Tax=Gastrolobium bilobum TaxID=150636 RepID=UPI002AB076E2|nr:protein ENHANCED PSEUDOMONAS SUSCEPTIBILITY 1-like [Gastrolobium bilobum]